MNLGKFGITIRHIGQKIASGTRWIGNKVGDALLSASPVLAAVNPALGGLAASAGGVAKGVGALAGAAEGALQGKGIDMNSIRSEAAKIKSAYGETRANLRSALERPR